MNFAPVMPAELYPYYDIGQYHMVQAHSLVRNTYAMSWATSRVGMGHTVIMDNGVVETGRPDVASLLTAGKVVHPTYIVCPDVLRDHDATMSNFYLHWKACARVASNVMIVPQSDTIEEWASNAIHMWNTAVARLGNRVYMGVPAVLDDTAVQGRWHAMLGLYERTSTIPPERLHLLGIWNSMVEVRDIVRKWPNLMGVDSSFPIATALCGLELRMDSPKVRLNSELWKMTYPEVTTRQHNLLRGNIKWIRERLNSWTRPSAKTVPTRDEQQSMVWVLPRQWPVQS